MGQKSPDLTVRTAVAAQCPSEIRRIPAEAHNPKTAQTPPLGVPVSYVSPFTITNQIVSGKWTFDPSIDLEYPFGRPEVTIYSPSPLMTYTPAQKITKIRRPSDTWAMVDCDYQQMDLGMGGSTSTTYIDYIPQFPVHGKNPGIRNYMFFDGSVRTVKTTY
jgi:prepilin-type processing-associated H-X9-DG protein